MASYRGVAAVVVALAHVIQIQWLPFVGTGSATHLVSSLASEFAVAAFFLLSGFLIAHSVSANTRANGKFLLSQYLAARLARIYPPFLLAVTVSLIVGATIYGFQLPGSQLPMRRPDDLYAARDLIELGRGDVLRALMFVGGMLSVNGPLWSLYIEVKLYLIFGLWVWALRCGWRAPVGLLLSIAVLHNGVQHNPGFLLYGAIWLMGCAIYHARLRQRWLADPFTVGLLGLAGAFLLLEFSGLLSRHGLGSSYSRVDMCRLIVGSAVLALLIFSTSYIISWAAALAGWSYSLYVLHFPVLLLFQSLAVHWDIGPMWMSCVTAIAVACVLLLAQAGGRLESRKDVIQSSILRSARAGLTTARGLVTPKPPEGGG